MPLSKQYIESRSTINQSGCWIWQLSETSSGFGYASVNGKAAKAHRVSYEAHKGPLPPGMVVRHTCGIKLCVNPDHLEAITKAQSAAENPNAIYPKGRVFERCARCGKKKIPRALVRCYCDS